MRIFYVLLLMLCMNTGASAAVVLQYHHVSDKTPASTSINPKLFLEHLQYLEDQKFTVVALPELVALLKDNKPLPDRTVAITFDDAYTSVYENAFPALKKRGWPFTIFINTEPHEKKRQGFASWEQLREMAKHGVTIANHTVSHPHLVRLQAGETEKDWQQRIGREITEAQTTIEKEIGQRHKLLAYPFGEYDARVIALARSLGFVAFGQQSGPLQASEGLWSLPRFPFGGSYGDLKDFAMKVNTLPFPTVKYRSWANPDAKTALKDDRVVAGNRPLLELEFENEKLAAAVRCFVSGQGAAALAVSGSRVRAHASNDLKAGRTRYNCTAPAGEGRFYWYTRQWLVTDRNGQWQHEG